MVIFRNLTDRSNNEYKEKKTTVYTGEHKLSFVMAHFAFIVMIFFVGWGISAFVEDVIIGNDNHPIKQYIISFIIAMILYFMIKEQ